MKKVKLVDLAKTLRSKNAGQDKYTFDIVFSDKVKYELVKNSGKINKQSIADLYNIQVDRISDFVEFDPALAIKFTIFRPVSSGSPNCADILGCQQYAPLYDIEIPVPD